MNNKNNKIKDNPLTQKADEIARLVYKTSKKFPKDELYGLTSQLRRAAVSIILNIIEGFARKGTKEYRNFLYISYGSLKETKYLLYFAHRENYLNTREYEEILNLTEEVGKMLWATIRTIEKKLNSQ
ncbi:MAG: hypothetical protein A3F94_02585 [Candidatus Spechtbacteria bacterium RIFCSPLOWO2_12_FULL_38_22]|uniref:Four helix bundle protein n=1 Tax=Candidatus Spechtbacteria bacterium RIFCSPLOWO2_12_FULL_38_22 TaxID=1802165 RepID=A0A1G2HI69_9BACT|nr:MAG: hypothetical protein A2728_01750 [Candidatus Spechtbacteria bacterium RIFCSPHIGHO2_01_FULL_38_11]OGZ59881.1 MAG: hypothetical protein A3A00_01175 [Candidatus Spechtbacteria bacterium RIFCSPLOWO2_01_FULL_38_20]OGZ62194.1 MAG: hypothetical protein A3F94_02585 [Candidatus Spechtbacteria bacterium RIFCSPLOWO2_12_FULL_38_22]